MEKVSLFSDIFDENYLKKCFCNNWKLKKEAVDTLIKILINFEGVKIPNFFIYSNDKTALFLKSWELAFIFLGDVVP